MAAPRSRASSVWLEVRGGHGAVTQTTYSLFWKFKTWSHLAEQTDLPPARSRLDPEQALKPPIGYESKKPFHGDYPTFGDPSVAAGVPCDGGSSLLRATPGLKEPDWRATLYIYSWKQLEGRSAETTASA